LLARLVAVCVEDGEQVADHVEDPSLSLALVVGVAALRRAAHRGPPEWYWG